MASPVALRADPTSLPHADQSPTPAQHQPLQEWLCAAYLSGTCRGNEECGGLHHELPYLWQALVDGVGWATLPWDGAELEKNFCQPGAIVYQTQIPLTYRTGESALVWLQVDFEEMVGQLNHAQEHAAEQSYLKIRRLSTPSYVIPSTTKGPGPSCKGDQEAEAPPASCPWRWYYDDSSAWKLFEQDKISPMQWVLEAKYLAGQRVYRFEVDLPKRTDQKQKEQVVFLIDFSLNKMYNMRDKHKCSIRRRPIYVSPDYCVLRKFPPFPSTKPIACNWCDLPETWYPVDQKSDYELVPLNPDSMDYHLVASEFQLSRQRNWQIQDIFRLQNPYLWQKFYSKKQHMELKNKNANELLLFHGTGTDVAVQAIFRQNFDWRLYGKNANLYGNGTYFARDASLSDRYTGGSAISLNWMFMARVLVGKYTKGKKGDMRPPPVDPNKPYGDLYDSCVNDPARPTIYVAFEMDQCYPEYVISYMR